MDDRASRLLTSLREETVVRSDGRYVIYYSWPADEAEAQGSGEPAEQQAQPAPPAQPWSPELDPSDV